MFTLQQLRIFQAVARDGSIGGGALALGLTQPTVSHHLAALEKELETPVLVRHARGVTLTDRGRILLTYADQILGSAQGAVQAIRDRAQLEEGELRIMTFATAGASFLPSLLAEFHRRHPAVRIRVSEHNDPSGGLLQVRDGAVDFAFIFTVPQWAHNVPELRIRSLFKDPLVVALPSSHRLAGQDVVDLADLAGEQWITQNTDHDAHHVTLLSACTAAGFAPSCPIRSDAFATIATYVAFGLGVALIPALAAANMPAGVRCLPVRSPGLFREVRMAYPADDASTPASAFVRVISAIDAQWWRQWTDVD
ncbi:DNA-binding transcriptional LysR family regulator [Kineosphaera limosa]|uniref:Putative LysR family transcriptional regulator n=1 Tax=Kineosphaera limosa NBRC 100340 TaxID=1184609 RepID=K6VMA6_9MICO|nr:LysR family transcriptional regulator [Kineosphaera limosa]NYE01782.1 DNA-binding transcriptional LysR family regulator [Kineosphaera limosa]GAB97333.1 putative LysR family transcriptional regulator [Kineosphaera limosa NBRC 100340]